MPTTNIVSLNKMINWFQLFQQNHRFLNDFGFGEPYDIGTSRQMKFPYMWVTMNEDSSIATASNVRSAIPDFSFSILFMDKINIQENYLDQNGFQSDNSQEILSDCVQYMQDLITWVQQEWGQYGVLFSQDVSFYPAVDETQDKATGIVARFVLRTRQVNCVIPENIYCLDPQITLQYLEVILNESTKFKLALFKEDTFSTPVNAQCNYIISGTAYGDMGTIYDGTEIITSGQHQHQFNLSAVLQPGEIVQDFKVHSVDTSQCLCPVVVDFTPYI